MTQDSDAPTQQVKLGCCAPFLVLPLVIPVVLLSDTLRGYIGFAGSYGLIGAVFAHREKWRQWWFWAAVLFLSALLGLLLTVVPTTPFDVGRGSGVAFLFLLFFGGFIWLSEKLVVTVLRKNRSPNSKPPPL